MSDVFSKEKRSWIMSRISGSNTKPEIIVRKIIHALGFRFRLHDRNLPGTPDIVLPRHKKVIFVHGCFWHGHKGCKRSTLPTTRSAFWKNKLNGNIVRDEENIKYLRRQGWKVHVVWQCQMRESNS
jgi:DNA mismatch endonuclease (patch repair protein)